MGALTTKWLARARQDEKKKRWQAAADNYQKVLRKEPENRDAVHGLGQILWRANQASKAEQLYAPLHQAGRLNRSQLCGYAQVLISCGKLQDAADLYQTILKEDPQYQHAWLGLGDVLARSGDHERAASTFRKLVSLDRENDYHGALLARELIASHQYGLARAVVKRLCKRMPDNVSMRLAYSEVLTKLGQNLLAIDELNNIELDDSNYVTVHVRLVHAYSHIGDSKGLLASLASLGEVIEKLPLAEQTELELLRCKNLLQRGEKKEAEQALRHLLSENSDLPGPWYQLADALPGSFDDSAIALLRQVIERAEVPAAKSLLLFALGMVLEKRGEHEGEVAAYEQANALAEEFNPYNPSALSIATKRIIDSYSGDWISGQAGVGDSEFRPIFILGMPRSGTTLLEQILGAHSMVETAGESTVMECALNERMAALDIESRQKYFQQHLKGQEITELAHSFRELIAEVAKSDSPYIAEKGMNNPRDAALLSAMFPNARFVYIRRHPLDIAWGCFKQNFATQNFSFTYSGIANQFACFVDLVKHWRNILPQGLYEISYESLVGDMRGSVEGLLDYIGLPWDDACLSFDKRKKEVVTASMNQIRQGLFTSAVGRWEKYGDLLLPLRKELEKAGVDLNYQP